ncbi:MAG: alpha-hydroxy-acid oxidizing protein [Burkholderiaceae bacterium]|nr:alpha-hydroxy-acid oxidizing protein [Burkholderiaceae bacterium]
MARTLEACLAVDDFERAARRVLPRPIFGYVSAFAEDGQSFDANREAFRRWSFNPGILVDTSQRTQARQLFDVEYRVPFGMAPVGLSALYTYRGDLALTEIARDRMLPMVLSSSSLIPMEDIARANPGAWFQAYLPGDITKIDALVDRVKRAGFRTLVVTVDTPANPNPESYRRAGFRSPLQWSPQLVWQGITHPRWTAGTFLRTVVRHGLPHFENNYATRGVAILARNVERSFADRSRLTWAHLRRVRELWPHRLVIKGVLRADDAATACDLGVDGIVVSNHGGRQLDGARAPLSVLPEIVQRCPGVPILIDGGIRRGTDVLKALALGAAFVLLGRPFAYAAAAGGRPGITRLIDLLEAEIDRDMAMLGICRLDELTPDRLVATSP